MVHFTLNSLPSCASILCFPSRLVSGTRRLFDGCSLTRTARALHVSPMFAFGVTCQALHLVIWSNPWVIAQTTSWANKTVFQNALLIIEHIHLPHTNNCRMMLWLGTLTKITSFCSCALTTALWSSAITLSERTVEREAYWLDLLKIQPCSYSLIR